MAQKQHVTDNDRLNTISVEPTLYEGWKVLFELTLENKNADFTIDV